MAQYWVYLNDQVAGPYALEQLIRVRGFSRQTLVCIDDGTGKPSNWISPANIPELAHIFKAADDQHANSPSASLPKPSPKPITRAPRVYTPAVVLKAPSRNFTSVRPWIILAACIGAGSFWSWSRHIHQGEEARELVSVQSLIKNAHLPSPSPYGSLLQYIQEKNIKARWEFKRLQDSIYQATLSWYGPTLVVYAFEVNAQAQTVRGLNTAATKLLSEGFPAPTSPAPKPAPVVKKSTAESFGPAIESRRTAIENGDSSAIWNFFSRRNRQEMAKGGISREGFVRLQNMTHRLDSVIKQNVLKTKEESENKMLVLIKQTQAGKPDIFVKQLWIYEEGSWKLDDEIKKSSQDSGLRTESVPSNQPSPQSSVPSTEVSPAKLPGMAH